MKKIALIAAAVGLLASPVMADTVTVRFEAPAAREDGTPLPASEISHYEIDYTINGVVQPMTRTPGNETEHTIIGATGRYCVVLRTVDTDTLVSAPTDPTCRKSKPGRPTILTVR
jgi:hypothetical protein